MPVIQFSLPEEIYYFLEKKSIEEKLGDENAPKPQALAKKLVENWYKDQMETTT